MWEYLEALVLQYPRHTVAHAGEFPYDSLTCEVYRIPDMDPTSLIIYEILRVDRSLSGKEHLTSFEGTLHFWRIQFRRCRNAKLLIDILAILDLFLIVSCLPPRHGVVRLAGNRKLAHCLSCNDCSLRADLHLELLSSYKPALRPLERVLDKVITGSDNKFTSQPLSSVWRTSNSYLKPHQLHTHTPKRSIDPYTLVPESKMSNSTIFVDTSDEFDREVETSSVSIWCISCGS